MTKRKVLLPPFSGVASGKIATVDIPVGDRYHVLWLVLGDNGGASTNNGADIPKSVGNLVDEIRLKVNGKIQRSMTGAELEAINALNGSPFKAKGYGTAGQAAYRVHLPIFLAEPWRKDVRDQDALAWSTRGLNSFQLEVTLKAVTAPVCEAFAEVDDSIIPQNPIPGYGALGLISKWFRQNYTASGFTINAGTETHTITVKGGLITGYTKSP